MNRVGSAAGRRARRGTSALEMACCLPPLVLILCAATDYAWLALTQHQMAHAARSASRYGITGLAEAPAVTSAPLVALCADAGAIGRSERTDRIRAIIAAETGPVLKPDRLCLTIGAYSGFQGVGRPEPIADVNGNGRQDPGEAYSDINGNGVWDPDQAIPTPGSADSVAVYTLRYVAMPLTGVTPGLSAGRSLALEARVVVRNEPF